MGLEHGGWEHGGRAGVGAWGAGLGWEHGGGAGWEHGGRGVSLIVADLKPFSAPLLIGSGMQLMT